MVFFKNAMIELWAYNESTTTYDEFGEPVKSYTLNNTVPCDIQQANIKEDTNKNYGHILQDTYNCFLDSSVTILPGMIARIQGQNETYTIEGSVNHRNHFIKTKHKKVLLKKMRKAETLTSNNAS